MIVDDNTLMAYADGELTGAERAAVEAAVAADPALAEVLARHMALRGAIRGAFEPILSEPLPPGLAALAGGADVTDLAVARESRQLHRPSLAARWGALAATLAVGVAAGYLLSGPSGMVGTAGDGLVARGDLARALERQLAADDPAAVGSPVRIGLTFRDAGGALCRSFSAARQDAVSGIACKSDDYWRLRLAIGAAPEIGGGYRQAAGETSVLEAVDTMISGSPFDAAAEKAARDGGWTR
ncbi:zf-HC2 domain-containing protein [Emcibacter sp. SYSU 3D8]|uniref:zf-HC2 domain-containing protein n=1 Tax=Emcibacter sp. SYSU 3D8 TaxID=3133969 RepID=UPI0031FEC96B